MIKRMWQDVLGNNLELGKFLDSKDRPYLRHHRPDQQPARALYRFNLRFYFNPSPALVKPIIRRMGALHKMTSTSGRSSWSNPRSAPNGTSGTSWSGQSAEDDLRQPRVQALLPRIRR